MQGRATFRLPAAGGPHRNDLQLLIKQVIKSRGRG